MLSFSALLALLLPVSSGSASPKPDGIPSATTADTILNGFLTFARNRLAKHGQIMPYKLPAPTRNTPTLRRRRSVHRFMAWDGNLAEDVATSLWDRPQAVLHQGECLQDKTRTTVARVEFASGSYLLKFHHWAGFWKTVSKSLSVSPNRRSFDYALRLVAVGLPTPRPLAFVEDRFGPLNIRSYLLTEFIDGESLYRVLRYQRLSNELVDHLARQIADIWQLLDNAQFSHNDLKPENFVVDRKHRVWLIDLENGKWHSDRRSLDRAQLDDAKRLLHPRSWRAQPNAVEVLRQRLLETPAVRSSVARLGASFHPFAQPHVGNDQTQHKLTVLIPCRETNEELSGCIESVRDFADEILVANAVTDDGTQERTEKLTGCREVRVNGTYNDSFRQRAISAAAHPWILWVEPNERVSTDLAKEIQMLLSEIPSGDEYQIERRNYCCNRPVRFGNLAADRPTRLFRKCSPVFWETPSKSNSERTPQQLKGKLIRHVSWSFEHLVTHDLHQAIDNAYTAHQGGRRASPWRMVVVPPICFLRSYVFKLGFLDGWLGLQLAMLSAIFAYVEYAKLWEIQRFHLHSDTRIRSEPHLLIARSANESTTTTRVFSAPQSNTSTRRAA